jgi:hypothetical protein
MKTTAILFCFLLSSYSLSLAQSTGGASPGANSSSPATGARGSPGNTLSNGSTINGTGGTPGPNTSNALNHGTSGNNLGPSQTNPSSSGNAVNTPAASAAAQSLHP